MRNSFINSLIEFNDQGGNAFLLVGDLGYSVVEKFCQEHPDNFINIGVAEQNMASIAAGMASRRLPCILLLNWQLQYIQLRRASQK